MLIKDVSVDMVVSYTDDNLKSHRGIVKEVGPGWFDYIDPEDEASGVQRAWANVKGMTRWEMHPDSIVDWEALMKTPDPSAPPTSEFEKTAWHNLQMLHGFERGKTERDAVRALTGLNVREIGNHNWRVRVSIIESQRVKIEGLKLQMTQMKKGYERKIKRLTPQSIEPNAYIQETLNRSWMREPPIPTMKRDDLRVGMCIRSTVTTSTEGFVLISDILPNAILYQIPEAYGPASDQTRVYVTFQSERRFVQFEEDIPWQPVSELCKLPVSCMIQTDPELGMYLQIPEVHQTLKSTVHDLAEVLLEPKDDSAPFHIMRDGVWYPATEAEARAWQQSIGSVDSGMLGIMHVANGEVWKHVDFLNAKLESLRTDLHSEIWMLGKIRGIDQGTLTLICNAIKGETKKTDNVA